MRVSLFGKVTAILAMGLGAATPIEIAGGAPSTDQYTDKTAMAQIDSWATPSSSLVAEYDSSLAQTQAGALGYKKVKTQYLFTSLYRVLQIVGDKDFVAN